MSHHGLICEQENIKYTLIQTPSLSFMCIFPRRLGQSVGWDLNLPSMISPCSTKSCTSSRGFCSKWESLPQFPLFPLSEWFPDSWVCYAALCESNCWTQSRGLISKLQPGAYVAISWLQAMKSSEKDSSEKHAWEIQAGSKTHAVSVWSTNVIHEKGWKNRGLM